MKTDNSNANGLLVTSALSLSVTLILNYLHILPDTILDILFGITIALLFLSLVFQPIHTTELATNLFAVNAVLVNFYIYDTGKTLLAFDAGIHPFFVRRGMKKLGLDPKKVSHLFLTHSDFDHVGGRNAFSNARVYLSRDEVPMITHEKARRGFMYNKSILHYEALENGQILTLEETPIQLISAPGHTPGSVCYKISDNILVTGDLLRVSKNGKIDPFPLMMNMDHSLDKETLEKLISNGLMENKLLLTGHTGIMKNS